jgi:hypothetical protein
MTEVDFRKSSADLGMQLDSLAFAAAFEGAQKLQRGTARPETYLARPQ